jgi:hypothetical protein
MSMPASAWRGLLAELPVAAWFFGVYAMAYLGVAVRLGIRLLRWLGRLLRRMWT